ncbi:hypothetical protein Dimus_009396 [Dionaea muscipula]
MSSIATKAQSCDYGILIEKQWFSQIGRRQNQTKPENERLLRKVDRLAGTNTKKGKQTGGSDQNSDPISCDAVAGPLFFLSYLACIRFAFALVNVEGIYMLHQYGTWNQSGAFAEIHMRDQGNLPQKSIDCLRVRAFYLGHSSSAVVT